MYYIYLLNEGDIKEIKYCWVLRLEGRVSQNDQGGGLLRLQGTAFDVGNAPAEPHRILFR